MAKKMILNIEVGERIVKVCVSDAKKKRAQFIYDRFMFQTPEGAVSDGHILDTEALGNALKAELEQRGVRAREVIFSLVSGKVGTREVSIPPVKDARIPAIVEANASEYFPVDLSKYHVGYIVQERVEKGDNPQCRLLVMIVPLTILESYFQLAERVGLDIQAIDYGGNSVYQALRRMSSDEVTMYVDVECTTSCVSTMRGGRQLLQRTFTNGVDDLVTSHIGAAGYEPDQYITALRELSAADGPNFLPAEEARENLSRLVSNIVRIVDYFNSNNWETPVERLVLTGSGCDVRGLKELVAETTSLPTDTLKDVAGVKGRGESEESPAHYLACIGSRIAPVDFMPEQFVPEKKGAGLDVTYEPDQLGKIVLVVGIALAVLLAYLALFRYYNAQMENRDLQEQIAELAYTEAIYNEYTAYTGFAGGLQALYDSTVTPNENLVAFIEELESKMPSSLIVLSAGFSATGVNMNVTVGSKEDAATLISQLRTFESLSDVQVSGISEGADQSGAGRVSFAVSCTYGGNPWLAATLPEPEEPEETTETDEMTEADETEEPEDQGAAAETDETAEPDEQQEGGR